MVLKMAFSLKLCKKIPDQVGNDVQGFTARTLAFSL